MLLKPMWMIFRLNGADSLPKIPWKARPKIVHTDPESAKTEIARLSALNPEAVFILLESVAGRMGTEEVVISKKGSLR